MRPQTTGRHDFGLENSPYDIYDAALVMAGTAVEKGSEDDLPVVCEALFGATSPEEGEVWKDLLKWARTEYKKTS